MLAFPAALTHDEASACLGQWLAQLPTAHTQTVFLDGSGLQRFDSSALSSVLALRRFLLVRGQTLSLTDLPLGLTELATLYGVDELLTA